MGGPGDRPADGVRRRFDAEQGGEIVEPDLAHGAGSWIAGHGVRPYPVRTPGPHSPAEPVANWCSAADRGAAGRRRATAHRHGKATKFGLAVPLGGIR
ncbi:hypothetical protein GCM10027605_50770 [Micromonospora zhanjiangensis]